MKNGSHYSTIEWQNLRRKILERDNNKCKECGVACESSEADVHHLMPRSLGGTDDPTNLITLCDGCHSAHHPQLQATLARRIIENWGVRLAIWLDKNNEITDEFMQLGAVLRFMKIQKLRSYQLDAIRAALNGKSVLLVSPTGSGKSICFQIPVILKPGVTFVLSPLKALMTEQVAGLIRKKIPATFINGDLCLSEKNVRYEWLENKVIKFFYCTPERFDENMVDEEEVEKISSVKPDYLVVDEAHCIDRWGGDFRPNYGQIGLIRQKLDNPPVLSFTATAGIETQRRILNSMGVSDAEVIVVDVDRPNITMVRLPVESSSDRFNIMTTAIKQIGHGKVMIFVPTVNIGNKVKEGLGANGLNVDFYNSQIKLPKDRDNILGRFTGRTKPEANVVICTNAFGMGLDVPNVRCVFHWQHPSSVEDYLQEFGRAGRDGKPSIAILFVDKTKDKSLLEFMADLPRDNPLLSPEEKNEVRKRKFKKIDDMSELVNNRGLCFRAGVRDYFDKRRARKRALALRILGWIFNKEPEIVKTKICCDRCDNIDGRNISPLFASICVE